ncbi:uncharacterized protein DNG_08139 [Cephalotrichum gorgonifer]|uniref:Uncharacterized protein n=1 Tax=Cephalotrichum gorgonifer TaxID=2041049 RepID=A0AAE8N3S4_9PEZI|nr:uncharacterized protein DNG_08139 [Cephalotrichum gorgonifer]
MALLASTMPEPLATRTEANLNSNNGGGIAMKVFGISIAVLLGGVMVTGICVSVRGKSLRYFGIWR